MVSSAILTLGLAKWGIVHFFLFADDNIHHANYNTATKQNKQEKPFLATATVSTCTYVHLRELHIALTACVFSILSSCTLDDYTYAYRGTTVYYLHTCSFT